MENIYVTTMYRYGDRESHSYVVYAGFSEKDAIKAGLDNKEYRGGKYYPEVIEMSNSIRKSIPYKLEEV